jgi:hypothetical protein
MTWLVARTKDTYHKTERSPRYHSRLATWSIITVAVFTLRGQPLGLPYLQS